MAYEKAVDISELLVKTQTNNLTRVRDLSEAYEKMVDVYQALGNQEQIYEFATQATTVLESLKDTWIFDSDDSKKLITLKAIIDNQ